VGRMLNMMVSRSSAGVYVILWRSLAKDHLSSENSATGIIIPSEWWAFLPFYYYGVLAGEG